MLIGEAASSDADFAGKGRRSETTAWYAQLYYQHGLKLPTVMFKTCDPADTTRCKAAN